MCEFWVYSCRHSFKTPCKLPKLSAQPMRNKLTTVSENNKALVQYDLSCASAGPGSTHPVSASRCCSGFPREPKQAPGPCFNCLSQDEDCKMQSMKPQVERLRRQRGGAGTDNWSYSSQGMTGYGQGGNSSWLDQNDGGHRGVGTYLGNGKVMPDKRQMRSNLLPQGHGPNMRMMPPGGGQSWPYGSGGTLSCNTSSNPSSAGGVSHAASHAGWGSGAGQSFNRNSSDTSAGSSSIGSFLNPWAHPNSDIGHVGGTDGKMAQGYGNGNFMPHMQMTPTPAPGTYALPSGPAGDAASNREKEYRDRYTDV